MSTHTTPHLDSAALITIDVQADVLDGQPLEIAGSSAALPAMRRLVEAFREHAAPIVHVVRLYRPDGSNVDLCRREAVAGGWRALAPASAGAAPAARPVGGRADRRAVLHARQRRGRGLVVVLTAPSRRVGRPGVSRSWWEPPRRATRSRRGWGCGTTTATSRVR